MASRSAFVCSEPITKALTNGKLIGVNNSTFVPEPEEDSECLPIWRGQSLISFSVRNKEIVF
ncbi:d 2 hydroxyglutarate dehydrogenase [Sesbania bispinosa]|nr:d 2 hydroxyglutarate dehydrogenase [Sesbania bispinosa]